MRPRLFSALQQATGARSPLVGRRMDDGSMALFSSRTVATTARRAVAPDRAGDGPSAASNLVSLGATWPRPTAAGPSASRRRRRRRSTRFSPRAATACWPMRRTEPPLWIDGPRRPRALFPVSSTRKKFFVTPSGVGASSHFSHLCISSESWTGDRAGGHRRFAPRSSSMTRTFDVRPTASSCYPGVGRTCAPARISRGDGDDSARRAGREP